MMKSYAWRSYARKIKPFMNILPHLHYQDAAIWKSYNWVIPIEGGIIVGVFARPGIPGICLTVLGTSVIVAFFIYAWKSRKDLMYNFSIFDRQKPRGAMFTASVRHWYQKGWNMLLYGFWLILFVNIFLILLQIFKIVGIFDPLVSEFFPICK